MFVLFWCISGLLGSLLMRVSWILDPDEKAPLWCMAPATYILLLFVASFGFITLALGVLYLVVFSFVYGDATNTWFFRPICKK